MNTSPLEADWNQEMFGFTPSPISIKEASILTQARWFFGTWVHHLIVLLAFWIKLLFLAPTICFSIYWFLVWEHREGNGTPLQHSCLENPMDGGAWWAAVYGVTQSRTRLKWLSSSSSVGVCELRLSIILFGCSSACLCITSSSLLFRSSDCC